MNREEKINTIISNRQSQKQQLLTRRNHLDNVQSQFNNLETCLSALESVQNDDDEKLLALQNIRSQIATSRDIISSLTITLNRLIGRCERNTINISVAGVPKQGKSTFLQALTGLDEATIPTGTSVVTGATSYLLNDPSAEETFAEVFPYTSQEFFTEVLRPFFESLKIDLPDSLDSFTSIVLPDSVGPLVEKSKELARLKQLQRYFTDYRTLLDHPPLKIPAKEIRSYVAQCSEDGTITYTKWYAIKKVDIHCRFPQQDIGKIKICDTPGLGDFTPGAQEKLLENLYNNTDILFFLKKFVPSRQDISEEDVKFYDIIQKESKAYQVKDWTYHILNIDANDKNKVEDLYLNKLKKDLSTRGIFEIDAKNTAIVETKFDEIINDIVSQIAELDRLLQANYEEETIALKESLVLIHDSCSKITNATEISVNDVMVYNETRIIYSNLNQKILSMRNKFQVAHNESTALMLAAIKSVIDGMKEKPDLSYDNSNIESEGTWFNDKLDMMRAEFITRFAELDLVLKGMVDKMQTELREILSSDDGGKLGFLVAPEASNDEFWDALKSALLTITPNERKHPLQALETIRRANIPIRALVMPRIRRITDIFRQNITHGTDNNIDSSTDKQDKNTEYRLNSPIPEELEYQRCDDIETCVAKHTERWDEARKLCIRELLQEDSPSKDIIELPANALYAFCDEFYLNWLRGGGREISYSNWTIFYKSPKIFAYVWPEVAGKTIKSYQLSRTWDEAILGLSEATNKF